MVLFKVYLVFVVIPFKRDIVQYDIVGRIMRSHTSSIENYILAKLTIVVTSITGETNRVVLQFGQ